MIRIEKKNCSVDIQFKGISDEDQAHLAVSSALGGLDTIECPCKLCTQARALAEMVSKKEDDIQNGCKKEE